MSKLTTVCVALAAAIIFSVPFVRSAEAADPPALKQAIKEQCKPLKPQKRRKCTRTLRREAKQAERASGRSNVFYLPARSMAVGMTDGMIAGLTEEQNEEALREMLTESSAAMAKTFVETMSDDLPEMEEVLAATSAQIEESMLNVMTGMLQDEVVDDAAAAAVELSTRLAIELGPMLEESARNVAGGVTEEMIAQLNPAMGSLLRDEIFPAFADAMNEEFNDKAKDLSGHITEGALEAIAVSIATDGGIGWAVEERAVSTMQRMLDEVEATTRPMDAWFQEEKGDAARAFWTVTVVLVLLMLLGAVLTRSLLKYWREARENEEAVMMVASELKQRESDEGVLDLVLSIRQREKMVPSRGGRALARIIDRDQGALKVEKDALRKRAEARGERF